LGFDLGLNVKPVEATGDGALGRAVFFDGFVTNRLTSLRN
jgi:hypothetical protein